MQRIQHTQTSINKWQCRIPTSQHTTEYLKQNTDRIMQHTKYTKMQTTTPYKCQNIIIQIPKYTKYKYNTIPKIQNPRIQTESKYKISEMQSYHKTPKYQIIKEYRNKYTTIHNTAIYKIHKYHK